MKIQDRIVHINPLIKSVSYLVDNVSSVFILPSDKSETNFSHLLNSVICSIIAINNTVKMVFITMLLVFIFSLL